MSLMPMNRGAYGQPVNDSGVLMQDISSQRKLAEQLRQQGAQQEQGQMISGHYIAPSWTSQLAKVLQSGLGGYLESDAQKKEGDYTREKARKFGEILAGNKPQQIEGSPTVTSTMPAYTPEQQDQFGSPLPNVQRTPVETSTPTFTQESPEALQARQQQAVLQYMQQYGNTPESQYLLSRMDKQDDRAYAHGEKLDDRQYGETIHTRDRDEKLYDINDQRRYEDIVRKDQQGFQVSQQDRQFAQQFQMQAQNQGFQAGENAKSRNFQAGQNALSREQQLAVAGLKGGAGTPAQKVNDAKDVIGILNQAAPLINKSTNSGLGNLYDQSAAFFGSSTGGAQSAASLKALEGSLVSKMPKMSGPQSDKDVLLYKQMAGQIGDPTLPAAQKKAAMDTILKLNSQYAGVPYQPLDFGDKPMTPSGALGGLPDQDAIAAEIARRGRK